MVKLSGIFNGSFVALEKETELKRSVNKLKKLGITPKLVSFVVGEIGGGKFYQNLKKKAGERVGVELEIIEFQESVSVNQLIKLIKKLNNDNSVHGIMVQLPLPTNLRLKTKDIINAIIPSKDVDGMRDNSPFLTPVTKAVLLALKEASNIVPGTEKVVVVGYKGFEGGKISKALKDMGYEVEGVDIRTNNLEVKTQKADILISATGESGLISGDMVANGVVVIDVGAPWGDVRTDEVVKKASFISPVPGGIGPVTISMLLENLVEAANESLKNK